MKRTIKKLYKGLAEVRDYDVHNCINLDKSLEIVHNEESMILSPEELKTERKSVSKVFNSKTGGKSYKLYGYEWNPDDE